MTATASSHRSGDRVVLADADAQSLRSRLAGDLLTPESPQYDQARTVWNAMVDQRPGLIARCASAADVVAAVDFARAHDLLVSVRSGGHNIAGKSVASDSFNIDLSRMKRVDVDEQRRIVRCESGLKLGELDEATQRYGLATVLGVATDTGMAGVAIGGGYGWLAGKYGMTCDNLIAAELVLADGKVARASADENRDLFWAIRGGGGNFGIVTSFEYQLHPVTEVLGGMILYPRAVAREFLQFFREYAAGAPDELTLIGFLLHSPDGDPAVAAAVCYCGPPDEGETVLAPLRAFGHPLADLIAPMPYLEQQKLTDAAWPPGDQYYWKTSLVSNLSDGAIDTLIEHAARAPNAECVVALQQLHGAATRVAPTDTAFAHRYDHFNFIPLARWRDGSEARQNIEWARSIWQALQPHADDAVYGNDLGDDVDERLGAAFGVNYEALATLKDRYDPANFFRLNQNISP